MSQLSEMYEQAAQLCRNSGVPLDAEPCGAIHAWVVQNVEFRPGTEFFIVTGIASAMADLDAQAEGFEDQLDRAADRMRNSDAYRRHVAKLDSLRPVRQ